MSTLGGSTVRRFDDLRFRLQKLATLPRRADCRQQHAIETNVSRYFPSRDYGDGHQEQHWIGTGTSSQHEVEIQCGSEKRRDTDECFEEDTDTDQEFPPGNQLGGSHDPLTIEHELEKLAIPAVTDGWP